MYCTAVLSPELGRAVDVLLDAGIKHVVSQKPKAKSQKPKAKSQKLKLNPFRVFFCPGGGSEF
jgi:hypothetical protein